MILIALNCSDAYRILLVHLIILVASYDTGAYIIGSLIGRHMLAPNISPQKSWEGCAGGYLAACLAQYGLYWFAGHQVGISFFGITALICLVAQVGDLFESYLKRRANVRHSGTLLSEHGGLMDRFDSLLTTGLLFWVLRSYLI